jgi:hypothetical protein
MNSAVAHYYREARDHQRQIQADGGGCLTTFPSGRTELTHGASYGEHAISAFLSAKRHVAFRAQLSKDVADHKRRSRSAKAAWKRRKARAKLEPLERNPFYDNVQWRRT